MPTNLQAELAELARWPFRKGAPNQKDFEQLARLEFLPAEAIRAGQESVLNALITRVAAKTPYYRGLFKKLGVDPADIRGIADLPRLPMLTRDKIQEQGEAFICMETKRGSQLLASRTSGSTGSPVEIQRSLKTWKLFAMLKQRELRWFRYDPKGTLASIRAPNDLPSRPGHPIKKGQTVGMKQWPQLGYWFQTGPYFGFGNDNSQESQARWLRKYDPDYLLMQSAELEHLAFAFQQGRALKNLKACQAVSQQMTAEMRGRIERIFGVPVHENYGLNEVSLVATRCPEGGRFHIHAENCLVEIVDDEGRPSRPGERGRILVTSLSNAVMPLIRYDADDLAVMADDLCPCGRTLPALTGIVGRYRRTALLPPGTWDRWVNLQLTLYHMPSDLAQPLRQYQLHQYRDNRYELRLVAAAPLAEAFKVHIQDFWRKFEEGEPPPLEIIEVESIPRPPGGKFQNFTSDFAPPPRPDELDTADDPLSHMDPPENA